MVLDGSVDWALSSSSRLTPNFEVGGRIDEGDLETGLGIEVAVGWRLPMCGSGLTSPHEPMASHAPR